MYAHGGVTVRLTVLLVWLKAGIVNVVGASTIAGVAMVSDPVPLQLFLYHGAAGTVPVALPVHVPNSFQAGVPVIVAPVGVMAAVSVAGSPVTVVMVGAGGDGRVAGKARVPVYGVHTAPGGNVRGAEYPQLVASDRNKPKGSSQGFNLPLST